MPGTSFWKTERAGSKMKCLLKTLILAFLLSSFVLTQTTQYKLKKVNVVGNTLTSETMVKYTSGLRDGEEIRVDDFAKAVKRLWDLGVFSNVQIYFNSEDEDGIEITIEMEESPVLGDVKFIGNKKIKERKFKEEIVFQRGMRLKPNFIKDTINKIKELYAEDGYLLVEVTAELKEPNESETLIGGKTAQTQDLVFKIKENKKVKIGQITFKGNHAFSDGKLRRKGFKDTKQQRWYTFWRSGYEEKKYQEDKQNLYSFYKNNGYRDFKIFSDSIYYSPDKKKMNILVNIYEGPRYIYRNFSWEGNTLFPTDVLNQTLDLKKGSFFSQEDFEEALYQHVQGLYMDRGYIYSQIEPRFTPVGDDSLDIHFLITENHQVRVRNIDIYGNTKTRENVIRRELRIYPGDVFNRTALQRSIRDLAILNYFDPTKLLPNVVPVDEDEVDLDISVEEKSSDKASASIGFTGIYGMTGGGSVEFNNFLGLGQVLSLSFQVGTQYSLYSGSEPAKYRSFSFRFMDPMIFDSPNRVGFSLFYQFRGSATQYYLPIDQIVRGGSVEWGRRWKWPDDYFRGYWVFQVMRRDYQGSEQDLNNYTGGLKKTLGINLTQVITRDSRDRPEFTTKGSMASWTATFSGGPLGGNEDYQKHILNLDWYTPTFWKFVLMSSVKMGMIRPLSSLKNELSIVPFDEKFIMGGNGLPYGIMLRGYPDNSIGPVSSQGTPIGGNTMFKYTTEFRFPFSENPVVYAMLFADAGAVWDNKNLMESLNFPRRYPIELKRSLGVGIRFFMPMIGMLGFDMGYGFDDITGNGKPQGWEYTIIFGYGQ